MTGPKTPRLSPSGHVADCLAEAMAWKAWQKVSNVTLEWDLANLAMVTVLNRIGPTQVGFWPWLTHGPVCTELGQAMWLSWKKVTPRETSYTKLGWGDSFAEAKQWLDARLGCLFPCESIKYSSDLWSGILPTYLWLLLSCSSPLAGLYTEPSKQFLTQLRRNLDITQPAQPAVVVPNATQHRRRLV